MRSFEKFLPLSSQKSYGLRLGVEVMPACPSYTKSQHDRLEALGGNQWHAKLLQPWKRDFLWVGEHKMSILSTIN